MVNSKLEAPVREVIVVGPVQLVYLVLADWLELHDLYSVSHIECWSFFDSNVVPALGHEVVSIQLVGFH